LPVFNYYCAVVVYPMGQEDIAPDIQNKNNNEINIKKNSSSYFFLLFFW